MVNEIGPEPYVLIERPLPAWRELPAGISEGRRPEIILVDRDAAARSTLASCLFDAGFDVYRTAEAAAARELVEGRSSILMAVVRMDQPELDPRRAIRELARLRPGLWIGMLGDDAAGAAVAAGYRAGADDLLPRSGDPHATAGRLARSVSGALGKRDRAARARHSEKRGRRAAAAAGAATAALGLATGVLLALATNSWHETLDRWDVRLDRLERLLDNAPVRNSWPRGPEFRPAADAVELERLREEGSYHREQLRESRLDSLFRNFVPRYPSP